MELTNLKFEEALSVLEKVVRQLENGDVSLEESLQLFEKGVMLTRLCNKRLDEAEGKIEVLLEKNGELIKEPFTPGLEDRQE